MKPPALCPTNSNAPDTMDREPPLPKRYPNEYVAWKNIKAIGSNPTHRHWNRYGGAGIRVCPQWRNSFETFLKDVGPKPSPKHRLSRKELTKDFCPGNVEWESLESWGSLKIPLPAGRSREDVQLASKVGKVVGVRHSALLIMLDNGLTTRELLSAKLQSLTPPPDH